MFKHFIILLSRVKGARGSRHSSVFPSILENDELETPKLTNQNVSTASDIKSGRYSVSSIGPNFAPRNSFGTQRNSNPALYNRIISQQISSDERIEKMKRIVFLNEDIDLFEDETLMASKNSKSLIDR